MNCPLVYGNPLEQTICWFFVNKSTVEYCGDNNNNKTFTLYDLLTSNDLNDDLTSSPTISNNDEDNVLLDTKRIDEETTQLSFINSILDQLINGEELQLLCWSINSFVGPQHKPCTIHLATSVQPALLIDCQVYNTTSHSLSVECEIDKINYWRIEQPITYQLDVNDDQTDALLFQLINNKKPTFELNQLPAARSLRLTVFSINKKGKSNKITLRTSTLIPSKWRAGKIDF